ncbi:hypothetical protein DA075_20905 [Methylobacterium currus]|uniref:Uncharacterized protein n=1 Tax=Methylobacterium currus TaxID=2051553 RepID=A0A2R4WNF9_9HYPH|nr:hypothetical protein [Methylobacterium currus]AWB23058.1 hypothetical protein DA075_20905 [Methylobacterium currus]
MKTFIPTAAAALLFGAWLGFGAAPAQAAQGCGPGFHRTVYGYCRPNYGGYYGAPGVYRGGYAYRGGVYGRRVYGGRVYGGRAYGGRAYGGRAVVARGGYGHRVGHYGGRGFAGGRGRR